MPRTSRVPAVEVKRFIYKKTAKISSKGSRKVTILFYKSLKKRAYERFR